MRNTIECFQAIKSQILLCLHISRNTSYMVSLIPVAAFVDESNKAAEIGHNLLSHSTLPSVIQSNSTDLQQFTENRIIWTICHMHFKLKYQRLALKKYLK